MKRILSLLLVLCMTVSFLPNISFAADDALAWTFGYNHTYSADDKTVDSRYTFDNFNAERADIYALAADGLFDYRRSEDPQLISYLSQKADEYNLENKKRTWEDIWSNWADNLLRESFIGIKTCHLLGNTGYHQSAAAVAEEQLPEHRAHRQNRQNPKNP